MSACYYIYAECRVNGKWISINPVVKNQDGSIKILELVYGKSNLASAYDRMCELKGLLPSFPNDLSEEVKAKLRSFDKGVCFNYEDAIKKQIKLDRPYKFKGYVDKRTIAAFEIQEIEEIDIWLTPQEFEQLPMESKKRYAWYEWNEIYDAYGVLYDTYRKVENLLEWNRESDYCENCASWNQDFISSNVRLIVCQD